MLVQGSNLIAKIFSNDTTLIYRHLGPFPGLLKFIQINLFYHWTKTVACRSPVVLSDLWKDSSSRKVDFSASRKCLRIRALVDLTSPTALIVLWQECRPLTSWWWFVLHTVSLWRVAADFKELAGVFCTPQLVLCEEIGNFLIFSRQICSENSSLPENCSYSIWLFQLDFLLGFSCEPSP